MEKYGEQMEPSEKLFVRGECQVTWPDSERKGDSNIAQPLFGFCCVRLRIYFCNGHVFALPLRCQTFSSHLRTKIFMQIGMKTRENFLFSPRTHANEGFSGLFMFWFGCLGGVFMQSGHRESFSGFLQKESPRGLL